MKKLFIVIGLFFPMLDFICGIGVARAATDEQMDKARAIAAKYYLRYANYMADYLDNINPSSMADIKGKLKEKDLENLKAFENTAYSKDYASWDKSQLSEYWGSTFFKEHSGTLDKAGQNLAAQRDIKSNIANMTVTVVQRQVPPDPERLSDIERLNNLVSLKENEVKKLKEDNEILKDLNDQLLEDKDKALRNNLRLASMFIYAPYNEMLIYNYAIPTFNKAKENELPLFYESTYQAIFEILKNYKSDCEVIAEVFNNAKKVDSSGKALHLADNLGMTSTYMRYSEFNDWEATYLGNLMNSLLKELKNYSANSPNKIKDLGAIFFANWNQQK